MIGMLLGYCAGAVLQHEEGTWKYVFLLALPVAVVFFFGTAALPPSPRWLLLRGHRAAAEASLRYAMPELDAQACDNLLGEDSLDEAPELDRDVVVARCENADDFSIAGAYASLMSTRASRAGLRAGLGLVVLQQVTGQPSVLYYVETVFGEAGLGNSATIALAAWKLVCTLLAVRFADSRGRRELLFIGCSLMAVALAVLVVTTSVFDGDGTAYSYCVLGAMFVYIGGYQVGFGPVSWAIISEIFPLRQRGKALSLAVFTNFALNSIVSFAAGPLFEISLPGTFALFLVLDIYSLYFVFNYVPETRGLSLEQITKMLEAFADLPMRQPIMHQDETQGFLPRRDSAVLSNVVGDYT